MLDPAPIDFEILLERVRRYLPEVDADRLRRAYELADRSHHGQQRDTGAPYIVHPLAVAAILAELELDLPTIMAGLLHDVVEDTTVDLETIRVEFGPDVASIVDGVTKLSQAELSRRTLEEESGDSPGPLVGAKTGEKAANIRKIFLAMTNDVRVMLVKLADRLHNMQTLDGLPAEKQRRVAEETLQIFAPIAHRLGIWRIKWRLEDLAFKYSMPEEYRRVSELLARTRTEREEVLEEAKRTLQERFDDYNREALAAGRKELHVEIQGRVKHLYSIWNKLRTQKLALQEIYDLIAVRAIVQTNEECYTVLSIVHALWIPIPGLFSDHIARPKPNNYQSLHTKVLGPRGNPIEVQIRTVEMHRTADYGIAAHWTYKEGGASDRRFEEKLGWLRTQLDDWQSDSTTDTDFLGAVVHDLFADQVFVFTPRGDVIDLPQGSGPLDFAFRIHSELGLHCAGARVNGKLCPLDYQFRNGDIVDIIHRPSAQPSYDWLNLVKTSHARSRIKTWFRKQHQAESSARGREMLEREMARVGLEPKELLTAERLLPIARSMNYRHEQDLLAAIGHRHVAVQTLINRLRSAEAPRPQIQARPMAQGVLRISAGDDVSCHRAQCCLPIPGEPIVGYVTRGKGLALHREDCPNLASSAESEPERLQPLEWAATSGQRFSTPLRLETLDREGLAATVFNALSERKVNVARVAIDTRPKGTAIWDLMVDVENLAELDDVIRSITAIPEILSAGRPGSLTRRRRTASTSRRALHTAH